MNHRQRTGRKAARSDRRTPETMPEGDFVTLCIIFRRARRVNLHRGPLQLWPARDVS